MDSASQDVPVPQPAAAQLLPPQPSVDASEDAASVGAAQVESEPPRAEGPTAADSVPAAEQHEASADEPSKPPLHVPPAQLDKAGTVAGIAFGVVFWGMVLSGIAWLVFGENTGKIQLSIAEVPELALSGFVSYKGQPVTNGRIELVLDEPRTSQHVGRAVRDVNRGAFDVVSFKDLKKTNGLRISATFSGTVVDAAQKSKEISAEEEIYTNCTPPFSTKTIVVTTLLLGLVSLGLIVLFTLNLTRRSAAFLFGSAYLFTFLSVAVPIIGLLFVAQNHYLIEVMKVSPIGIVVAKTKDEAKPQWLLNVGGVVVAPPPVPRDAGNAKSKDTPPPAEYSVASGATLAPASSATPTTPAPAASVTGSASATRNAPVAAGAPVAASTPGSSVEAQPTKAASVPSAGLAPAAASAASGAADSSIEPTPVPASSGVRTDPDVKATAEVPHADLPEVDKLPIVEGGLAIPFYVIVLSMFGAGINMMRRVPEIQAEKMQELPEATEPVMGSGMLRFKKTQPATPTEPTQKQFIATCDIREAIIKQYMYLLSAPLLAIAVYYLLQIIATNISEPVLVLMAFSAGLISENIVTAVITFAAGTLGSANPRLNKNEKNATT
jgi:hypothetical protein